MIGAFRRRRAKEKPLAETAATMHFDLMLDQEIAIDLKAKPEAVRRARRGLTEHAGCFWMRQGAAFANERGEIGWFDDPGCKLHLATLSGSLPRLVGIHCPL